MRLEYKCRRCGSIDDSTGTADDNAINILVCIQLGADTGLGGVQPRMTKMHCCKDGSYGIADLIGCKLEAPPKY